jgi:hypothetical protein
MKRTPHFTRLLALVGLALGVGTASAAGNDGLDRAARIVDHTTALDYAEAHKELEGLDLESPAVAIAAARLAIYEHDCDRAVTLLSRPDVARVEAAGPLAEIAGGCARVTAATVLERDEAAAIEVRFQDELDRPLLPMLVDTIKKARETLSKDLDVDWPKPTRVTVVRDLLSLSAMTGLPYQAAQTTGTVAVAKWGRVTLLSPRASRHGYSWRDTMAHELTHLAVTRATADRAPLWLQEGVAKREEVLWRAPGPFDARPSPDSIALRGIELKLDLPLDKLGPSLAMLPSADAALVAFAEVTSFVQFYARSAGPDALPKLMREIRTKRTVDEALVAASGADLKAWDAKWRAHFQAANVDKLPPVFSIGQAPAHHKEIRERVRLAELLFGRSHVDEALKELEPLQKIADANLDPSTRYVRGRALEAAARAKDAEAAVGEPKDVLASYGPWWALRGRLAHARNDAAVAEPSFWEALAADPLDVEAACETLGDDPPPDPAKRPLCDAARHRGEPPLGRD